MANSSMIPEVDRGEARREILAALAGFDYEATESEVVVATGIPDGLVEDSLAQLARVYRCEQRVGENAEVSYRFAPGFRLRKDRPESRKVLLRGISTTAGALLRLIFRRLLVVPLVGYFALFVFLALPLGLFIFAVIMAFFWTLETLLRRGSGRTHTRPMARLSSARRLDRPGLSMGRGVATGVLGIRQIDRTADARGALYSYLFPRGRRELFSWKKRQVREVLRFLCCSRGMVTRAEIMGLTGLPVGQAGAYASELLRAYEGEPVVTEGGTVVYSFVQLLASSRWCRWSDQPAHARPAHAKAAHAKPDREGCSDCREATTKRLGRSITFMNGVNLFFGVFYGVLSLGRLAPSAGATGERSSSGVWRLLADIHPFIFGALQVAHPLGIAALVVGIIPAGIASLYFALHIAAGRERARIRRAKRRRQLRKLVYSQVLSNPASVDPSRIEVGGRPSEQTDSREQVARIVDELAAAYGAEIEDTGKGHFVYHFPDLEFQMHDLNSARRAANPVLLAPGSGVIRSPGRGVDRPR